MYAQRESAPHPGPGGLATALETLIIVEAVGFLALVAGNVVLALA
jgi:hypothetical protein